MKKKINISVCDIVHKVSSPKNVVLPQYIQPTIVVDKPVRFEDLYKKVVEQHNKHGDTNNLKIVYDSKKTTPMPTNRNKKNSINSLINKSTVSSAANSRKKSLTCITPSQRITNFQHQKKLSKQKIQSNIATLRNSKQKNSKTKQQLINQPNNESVKKTRNNSKIKITNDIDQCFKFLNHEQHSHLRQGNQCFLSERQIDFIVNKIGYNIKHPIYSDFLTLLQVDIYGGAPSQNLKQVLKIIQHKNIHNIDVKCSIKKKLPKIIDNNLQLTVTPEQQQIIQNYFIDFKKPQQILTTQKQNLGMYANCKQFQPNQIQSFENILKQRQISSSLKITKQFDYSSPDKKITNAAIYQLIQALSQSDNKKSDNKRSDNKQNSNKSLQKVLTKIDLSNKKQQLKNQQQHIQDNLGTFRKIDAPMIQSIQGQYNFSRQLSGDKKLQPNQDDNIVQLKNRLNQALKKSSLQTNQFISQDHQYADFICANAIKYTRKPILSIDVNLGEGISQKIMVYEGETARQVADRLAAKFSINLQTKNKFQKMLESHLNTVLWKIDQVSEEMLTDRDP